MRSHRKDRGSGVASGRSCRAAVTGPKITDMASLPHGPRRSLQTLIAPLHQGFGVTLCTTIATNDCLLDTGQTGSCILLGHLQHRNVHRPVRQCSDVRCSCPASVHTMYIVRCRPCPRSSQAAVVHCEISLSTSRPIPRTITIDPCEASLSRDRQ